MLNMGKKLFSMYSSKFSNSEGDGNPTPAFGRSTDPTKLLSSMAEAVSGDNKWKLTNIGGIGSDEDKQLREKAAESEPQFEGAGQTPGIEIWRIEKFQPEKITARTGNLSLYSGDCYIILNTIELESGQFEWQLHYWIGKDSSQDESGSAAYFTVNIDDLLDQKPVQHRQVQHSESALFHSYFQSVTYLEGGIDSGFKAVEPEVYKPRLLQMATFGSTVRVLQVPLEAASLNNGDVFILDNGLTVYQFNAPNSDSKERRRAMEIVQQDIREDRDGLPELTILDGDEVFSCDPFWELLGGKVDDLPDPESGRDTEITDDVNFSASKKLFKISDESGSLVLSLEKEAESVSEDDMNDEDVWVVACDGKCFIHIAENTSKDEKFYVWNSCGSVLLAAGLDETAPTTFFSKHSDASLWRSLFA